MNACWHASGKCGTVYACMHAYKVIAITRCDTEMRCYRVLRGEVHKKNVRQIMGTKKGLRRKVRLTTIYHVGLKQKRDTKIDLGSSEVK